MRLQKRAVSQAVRRKEGVQEFYYPKEWFAQKESTQMTMYRGTEEWKEKAQQPLGSELSMDERRNMFWRMEKAMTDVEEYKKGVGMFFLPFLDWSIKDGCKPFLSPAHAHKLYSNIHQRHVDELVRFTAGSPEEAAPLDALISTTSFDATQASIHFHACMHWNMLFFWKSIVPFGSVDVPVRTRQAIWKYFNDDGLKQLEKEFISAGMDMVGNGFVWLVWNPALQVLQVRTTERHQCPKVLDLYPLLCCNVWDNAITPGYELNKLEYLRRFWLCVDWTWVDKCYGWLSTEIQELSIDVLGQSSPKEVHLFPVMPSFRDERFMKNYARGSREEPLDGVTNEWSNWKKQRSLEDPVVYGPGMRMANEQDQETEFLWKASQNYHILSVHAGFTSPYPFHYPTWDQTSRWLGQMGAKAELRRSAVHPPNSGIMWPEEPGTNLLSVDPEEDDEIEEFGEDSPMPWKEMREKWFHSNTHEKEFDFWKKRKNRDWDKQGLYYGSVMKSG